jgi:hypothetical protein
MKTGGPEGNLRQPQRKVDLQKTVYRGWPNCYRLSNGLIDLIVTTDVGPRIIRFGFEDEENEFKEYEDTAGKVGGDEWRIYGGHRLWHAPEERPRTYCPDNSPVTLEEHGDFVRLIQPTEPPTGIQKEIDLCLSPTAAHVEVIHRLRNTNLWSVELAPWALSVMAEGGTAIIPLPPRRSHRESLLPATTIALWAYTDMTDPRWHWGPKYVMLSQDSNRDSPQKAGVMVTDGWAAYARAGHLFVKRFSYVEGAPYPDLGCSVEAFTNADMLELETLGPLAHLPPSGAVEHIERWHLFRKVPTPRNDADVDRDVLPLVKTALAG